MAWEPPSPRIAEHIRNMARLLLASPDDAFAEVDAATFEHADPALLADPALVEAIRRTTRANLRRWAEANLANPGAPVAAELTPDGLNIARDLVRRGLDWSSLDTYRTGQNRAWRLWMQLAFAVTRDPEELAELLDVSARSVFAYVDAMIAKLNDQLAQERERLRSGTLAERLEVVTLILEGAPIPAQRASSRLGYALDRAHTAAVVFHDDASSDPTALQHVAEALARAAGARRPFTVTASAAAVWAWIPAETGPTQDDVAAALQAFPDVRVALGPTERGLAGFRRSHLDALATQRLLHRTPDAVRFATYDDVQVVALVTQDEDRARELVERTLGPLAAAAPELRETLRTYLREDHSATKAAKALFAHRNTVLNRLARAQDLLPRPLEGRGLQVGLALEVVRWIGPATRAGPDAPR